MIAFIGTATYFTATGQSGRVKKPEKPPAKQTKPPKAASTPVISATANPSPTPPNDDNVDPSEIIRVAANLVSIPTSVADAQGRSINDLTLQDFELLVDGEVQPIADLQRAETPVRLALLFDNSSSVTSAREFEKQAAIRFFRRVLRKQDMAAVYGVSTTTELVQPLTSDTKLLVHAIERFANPEGATSLHDGVVMAAKYLAPEPGRHVIVIVSDGDDTSSDAKFETSVVYAQAADCQVYVVQTTKIENTARTGNATGSANLRALAAERRMEEYAAATGGTVYAPYSVRELDPAFTQIAADLAAQYILNYYPQDEKYDGKFKKLTVRIAKRPNLRVRARRGYYTPRS